MTTTTEDSQVRAETSMGYSITVANTCTEWVALYWK